MTIAEMRYQASTNFKRNGLTWGDRGIIFAAGRYQMIPSTAYYAMGLAGLTVSVVFSKENQEKMMDALLFSLEGVSAYIKGKNEGTFAQLSTAVQSIGGCWASLPVIRVGNKGPIVGDVVTGAGTKGNFPDGVNPNVTKITIGQVVQIVIKTRIDYSKRPPRDIPTYYNL